MLLLVIALFGIIFPALFVCLLNATPELLSALVGKISHQINGIITWHQEFIVAMISTWCHVNGVQLIISDHLILE